MAFAAIVWCGPTTPPLADAAEPIEVQTESGRVFRGEIDARTDGERLVLRSGTAAMRVLRPIAWDAIRSAKSGVETWTADELRAAATELASPAPKLVPRPSSPIAREAANIEANDSRPVDLSAYVRAANWDSDFEIDGLVVELSHLNADGERVAANVSLEATLIAQRRVDFSSRPQGQGVAFERIGQWSQVVRAEEFAGGRAFVRLPFQAVRPERDVTISTHGLVHLRIGIPGLGVWDRSFDGIRLRPYAPTRDSFERIEGQRFFNVETLGP